MRVNRLPPHVPQSGIVNIVVTEFKRALVSDDTLAAIIRHQLLMQLVRVNLKLRLCWSEQFNTVKILLLLLHCG